MANQPAPLLEFRKNELFLTEIRAILGNEVMQRALLALKDSNVPVDVDLSAPDIASVRLLSFSAGYTKAIADFLSLSDAIPAPPAEEESTYEQP